ncbi:MAG: hypothetical protein Q8O00_16625, partial [Holophaga sp.]|nr:hypothetical protein [Holophaga sp.]
MSRKPTSLCALALLFLLSPLAAQEIWYAGFETGAHFPFNEPSLNRGTVRILTEGAYAGRYALQATIENETVSGMRLAYVN